MTRRANLRASDSDRERVAERLRLAAAEGRLLAEELEERLGAALTARTYGELDAVVADLPATTAVGPSQRSSLTRRPAALVALGILLIALLASAFAGHGHPAHHWGGEGDGAWVIWLVWLAIGWRLVRRRGRVR